MSTTRKILAGVAAAMAVGVATVDVIPTETFWVGVVQRREDGTKVCLNKFYEPDGDVVVAETPCEEYWRVAKTPDYPAPSKRGRVSLIEPTRASAAIAYDTVSNSGVEALAESLSWSHTTTGSNTALFVGTASQDSSSTDVDISSATYNGVSLTVPSLSDCGQTTIAVASADAYLLGPATGTHTVEVTMVGTNTRVVGFALTLTGVDQTTGFSDHDCLFAADTATYTGDAVTVPDNGMIVDVISGSTVGTTLTAVAADQTKRDQVNVTTSREGGVSTRPIATAGDYSMQWSCTTCTASADWAGSYIVFAPAAEGGAAANNTPQWWSDF